MKDPYAQTWTGLRKLAETNSREDWLRQEIHPPRLPVATTIRTLDGARIPLSPMLHARFEFCSRWDDADLGHDWFAIEEIPKQARMLQPQIRLRAANWPTSQLARAKRERLAVCLFGRDPEEHDETYLIWSAGHRAEPMVVRYTGHEERVFPSLLALLVHTAR